MNGMKFKKQIMQLFSAELSKVLEAMNREFAA